MTEAYLDLGWMNGWGKPYPEKYQKCKRMKHKTIEINRDPSWHGMHTEVICHVCKLKWHYDSSG